MQRLKERSGLAPGQKGDDEITRNARAGGARAVLRVRVVRCSVGVTGRCVENNVTVPHVTTTSRAYQPPTCLRVKTLVRGATSSLRLSRTKVLLLASTRRLGPRGLTVTS